MNKKKPARQEAAVQQRGLATAIAEKLGLVKRGAPFISLIYGPPMAGKTRFSLRLAAEFGAPVFVIMTEPNARLYGYLDWARQALPPFKCGGVEGPPAYYTDDAAQLYHLVAQALSCMDEGLLVVDSLSAIAIHEQARQMFASGRPETLPVVQRTAAVANSLVQWIAGVVSDKRVNILITAQETPAINRPWYGQPTAPAYVGRSLHNVGAVARMWVEGVTRVVKTVLHRNTDYVGKWEELPPELL